MEGISGIEHRSKASTRAEKVSPRVSLGEKVWGFRWHELLPVPLNDRGLTLHLSSFDEVAHFLQDHYQEIFELEKNSNGFLYAESARTKETFYLETMDVFTFHFEGVLAGVAILGPTDWSTYYIRHVALKKEFQSLGACTALVEYLLRHCAQWKIPRLQADTSPANFAVIQILSKLKFNITGYQLSERWGSNLQFTKFLDPNHEKVFLDQFCFGVRPQTSPGQKDASKNQKTRRDIK